MKNCNQDAEERKREQSRERKKKSHATMAKREDQIDQEKLKCGEFFNTKFNLDKHKDACQGHNDKKTRNRDRKRKERAMKSEGEKQLELLKNKIYKFQDKEEQTKVKKRKLNKEDYEN